MFRAINFPIFRNTRRCVTACGIMQPRCCRPAPSWVHYTTSCNTQSSAPEDVELTGIFNKPLLLHLVGCLYYLYQWCTVKKISANEIYLLIKCIKSVLCRVEKRLSYIEDAGCLKVNDLIRYQPKGKQCLWKVDSRLTGASKSCRRTVEILEYATTNTLRLVEYLSKSLQ